MSGKGYNCQSGQSSCNGDAIRLVRSWQGAGWNIRPATIWDYMEPLMSV